MLHFVNSMSTLLLAKSMCKNNNIVFLFCTTTALLFILASAGSCFFSTLGLFRALLGHCGSYIGSVHVCSGFMGTIEPILLTTLRVDP